MKTRLPSIALCCAPTLAAALAAMNGNDARVPSTDELLSELK